MIIVIRETVHLWFLEKSLESGSTGCPPPPPPQGIGTPKIKIKNYSQRFIFWAIRHKLRQEGIRRRRHWQCCWKVKDTDKTDGVHWSDHLVLQTECTSKSSVPIAAIGREKEEIWAVSVFFVYKSVPISKNRNFASFGGAILFSCQSQRQELRKIEGYFFIGFPLILRLRLGNETIFFIPALESR